MNVATACHVAVDVVVLTVHKGMLKALLIERVKAPFRGRLALPGGYLEPDEDLDESARQKLVEKTGVNSARLHLEQLRTYGAPNRDPRGRVVSVAYLAMTPMPFELLAGSDARTAMWIPVNTVVSSNIEMAFDHRTILVDAIERAKAKLEYTTLATEFCAETFTVSELRAVYEVVWDMQLDPRNFNRKVTKTVGFLVPTGHQRNSEAGRPAALYRRGPAMALSPPMLRTGIGEADR